ncbi:MAG: tetratricopeptide repeat protein [Sedimentisphaerales bacterium]|nr:tetratricopeptide repeat protein [Sedimentisphaerales bacterium]
MAQKRLNKKMLATLSLVAMAIVVIGTILFLKYRFKDPKPFMDEAHRLVEEGRRLAAEERDQAAALTDPEAAYKTLMESRDQGSLKKWMEARDALTSAVNYSRGDFALRMQAIQELAELYIEAQLFEGAKQYWEAMVKQQSPNLYARRHLAQYDYELAKNSPRSQWPTVWAQVRSRAEQLIQLAPDDPYGYELDAHALMKLVDAGSSPNEKEQLAEADALVDKALQLDPNSVAGCYLRAYRAFLPAGDKNTPEALTAAAAQAETVLRQAIEANPQDPQAYENLFELVLLGRVQQAYTAAAAIVDPTIRSQKRREARTVLDPILRELDRCIAMFPQRGQFYALKARLLRLEGYDPKVYQQLIDCFHQALATPEIDTAWFLDVGNLYWLRADNQYGQDGMEDWHSAYTILRRGLYDWSFLQMGGPESMIRQNTRLSIMRRLIQVCTELALRETDDQKKESYLTEAEHLSGRLSETIGDQNPYSQIAAGQIAWARGRTEEAIRRLYRADEALSAENHIDRDLRMKLFRVLRETEHYSYGLHYGEVALQPVEGREKDFVDFLQAAARVSSRLLQRQILGWIERFEEQMGNAYRYRSRVQQVRAELLINLDRRAEAQEILQTLEAPDESLRLLRAQALPEVQQRVKALEAIVREQPAAEPLVRSLVQYYLEEGRANKAVLEPARQIIARAVQADGQNRYFVQMQLMLDEPDPNAIPPDRMNQIVEESIRRTSPPQRRDLEMAQHYFRLADWSVVQGDAETAQRYWQKASQLFEAAQRQDPQGAESVRGLFDIALRLKDYARADALLAQLKSLDPTNALLCQGLLHAEHQQWIESADSLVQFLRQRPVSVTGHLSLAHVYQAQNRTEEALAQARTAYQQDLNHGGAMRMLLALQHQRNQETARKSGWESLSHGQIYEQIQLTNRILLLQPDDVEALSMQVVYYPLWIGLWKAQLEEPAGGLSPEDREKIVQQMQQAQQIAENACHRLIALYPSRPQNWQALANIIYQYAEMTSDSAQRQESLRRAESVFRQALQANPQSTELAVSYARFLETTGREQNAEQMLQNMVAESSGDAQIQARLRLAQMYQEDPELYPQALEQYQAILQQDEFHRAASLFLAGLLVKQRQLDEALAVLQKLRGHQDDPDLISQELVYLLEAGRVEDAEKLLAELKSKFPSYEHIPLIAGNIELFKAQYVAAAAYADQVLQNHPDHPRALLLKAKALFYDRKYSPAEQILLQLRRQLPATSDMGRAELSQVYWEQGRRAEAIQELEMAWRDNPQSELIRSQLMDRLDQDGRLDRLEALYDQALERSPDSIRLHVEAARVARRRGDEQRKLNRPRLATQYLEKAVALWQKAAAMSSYPPDRVNPLRLGWMAAEVRLGRHFLQLRQTAPAREHLQKALALAQEDLKLHADFPGLTLVMAEASFALGERSQAIDMYERTLLRVQDQVRTSELVLLQITGIGAVDEMIAWAEKKLKEQPDSVIFRRALARLQQLNRNYAEQIRNLESARKLTQDDDLLFLIDQMLAEAYLQNNLPDQALDSYQRLLERQPENVSILNNLAYLLMDRPDRQADAAALAEKAFQLAPGEPDIMDTYAVTLLRGNTPESFRKADLILRRAIQQKQRQGNPVPVGMYYHLGQALQGQQRGDDAREQFRLALNLLESGQASVEEETLKPKLLQALEELKP